jgi:hypothetical protein
MRDESRLDYTLWGVCQGNIPAIAHLYQYQSSQDKWKCELTSGVWKSTPILRANLRSEAVALKSPLRPAESPT